MLSVGQKCSKEIAALAAEQAVSRFWCCLHGDRKSRGTLREFLAHTTTPKGWPALSAVSEAPDSRQVVDRGPLEGRFRYSDLKEAAPRGSLWGLYTVEPVPMVCKVAVGGCARQLPREIVRFEAAGRGWREGGQDILGQMRHTSSVRAGARG